MAGDFFYVIVDEQLTRFEKSRILSIEPSEVGTKIIMEASHVAEEPIIYFSKEPYDKVMKSYLS